MDTQVKPGGTSLDNAPPRREAAETYQYDPRELSFVLWEFVEVQKHFLHKPPADAVDRADCERLIERAMGFAKDLSASFYDGEREPAHLGADGKVRIPQAYYAMWERYTREWSWMRRHGEAISPSHTVEPRFPLSVYQLVAELLSGANPSLTMYGCFTPSAATLIRSRGTDRQREVLLDKLERSEWDACFCATEHPAGSDLSLMQTTAKQIEGEVYAVTGTKLYITAGMHELTENTIYMVLGRVDEFAASPMAISCFLVPRYWPNEDGTLEDNHVACLSVANKMGLDGCANTELGFGKFGVTRGFLLGNKKNVAWMQVSMLLRKARVATGALGVALASSAYLHSVRYARERRQGASFEQSANVRALRVPIIEHRGVQRLLMKMKATVEGSRLLLARVALHSSHIQRLIREYEAKGLPVDQEDVRRHGRLALFYSPIAKAYVSDAAWDVVTDAIQVHGAVGYLKDLPLEQYARDIKILSIWEGTNEIQSQDLVRDKLSFGRNQLVLGDFRDEVLSSIELLSVHPNLHDEVVLLRNAFDAMMSSMSTISDMAGTDMLKLSQFCTRVLKMFGDFIIGWNLMVAAGIAQAALSRGDISASDRAFYSGKVKVARYYMHNHIQDVHSAVAVIANHERGHVVFESDEFASL